jgi:hypothetical protein
MNGFRLDSGASADFSDGTLGLGFLCIEFADSAVVSAGTALCARQQGFCGASS